MLLVCLLQICCMWERANVYNGVKLVELHFYLFVRGFISDDITHWQSVKALGSILMLTWVFRCNKTLNRQTRIERIWKFSTLPFFSRMICVIINLLERLNNIMGILWIFSEAYQSEFLFTAIWIIFIVVHYNAELNPFSKKM